MSGATTAAAITAAAAIAAAGIGGGISLYQGQQQAAAQKKALKTQQSQQANAYQDAQAQQRRSELAMNKADQKQPDMSAIMKAAASPGQSATMLTGPQGIDPASLALGKSTLLGQ